MPQRPAATDGTWEDWMAAALTGDGRAYEHLLRAMLPMLREIARRHIDGHAEAEAAVQDALLTIHALRHTCLPERPVRPWAAAICERRCAGRRAAPMPVARRRSRLRMFSATAHPCHGQEGAMP